MLLWRENSSDIVNILRLYDKDKDLWSEDKDKDLTLKDKDKDLWSEDNWQGQRLNA